MGEEKKNSKNVPQEKFDVKEVRIDRVITEQDVERFNEMSPITITITNTRNQNPNVIAKLKKNVTIRVLGAFDEKRFPEYSNERYYRQTTYSPEEISGVIEFLNRIESLERPEWSDLEKATFGYVNLMSEISPKRETEENEDNRPLKQLLDGKADSRGYAFIYKELMDRLGVACRYIESPKSYAWNEVLINGEYYPADLFMDASLNEETIKNGGFELRNFLSDKEFYYMPEHNLGKKKEEFHSLDHSEIQKAIDKTMNPENYVKKEIPKIPLKSKELQEALKTSEILNTESFGEREQIKIDLRDQNITELKDDLVEIGRYYPRALDNIIFSNNTGTHIDMQEVIDAVYEGRKNEDGKVSNPTQITIESNLPEDFNIDFSNAPEVEVDKNQKYEDVSYSQKISFVNTSSSPLKLPDLSGKIPDSIDTISITDCDVSGFDIKSITPVGRGSGPLANGRRIELVGGNTYGVSSISGLNDVISLSVKGLNQSEFDDIMNIAISNSGSTTMPRLFELGVDNQNLAGRNFLEEIKNPNIVNLSVNFSMLNNVNGLDALQQQLVRLSLQGNDLSIDDMKKISGVLENNELLRYSYFGNSSISNAINGLNGDVISDETFNYLDSYFRRSGYTKYRALNYTNYTNIIDKKKELLKDFTRWDLSKVPYFIEDAKTFRSILPYINNPIMVKDLSTFQSYLNDPTNYFEQDFLKDGNLWLTREQLESLIASGKRIQQNISLKINTVKELSKEDLRLLKDNCDRIGLNFTGVNVFDDRCIDPANPTLHNFDEIDTHLAQYKIDEYYKIRDAIEEITEGIHSGMSDLEKFAVIYHRLAQKVSEYDEAAHGDVVSKEHAIYQAKMVNKARNLSEGLIEQEGFDLNTNAPNPTLANRAVCAGYADILKNALDFVEIQSIIDSGMAIMNHTTGKPEGGHEWNKVKIDGKWYYADLTWDAGKNNYKWALKGSNKFEKSGDVRFDRRGNQVEVNCHLTYIDSSERNENVEQNDFDQALLKDTIYRVKNNELPSKYKINIPENPDFTFNPTVDIENIKQQYIDRKNDMLAKFYGDKDYQRRYDEIAQRYRNNEIEVTDSGITYRTVQDYAEREEDEKFLILGEYKNALERMSKYEAGANNIYKGSDAQIQAQYEKDKEYVETRNYTFDQHKNTQRDLATLGKYGEKMPYIPRQQGIIKNGLRVIGNVGIFARNAVAPIYRFIGRNIAQPLHRAITRGKDASPYRNNPYHRFVARRDYFKDVANQADVANGKSHPIRNYVMSNINSIARYKQGNEAVLKAGAYDIQDNLKRQEMQKMGRSFYNTKRAELESQITALEDEITKHGEAENLEEAKNKLNAKKALLNRLDEYIVTLNTTGKITDIQTDAISQTQHDIASKEVNTYRVAAIKGVAKLGIKKFVGPKIKDWLSEHAEQTITREEPYQATIFTEKEVQDPPKTISITEQRPDYDIEVDELIERSKDKTVNMYRSVSGGNRGEIAYTIRGDEVCSGFHFQDGTKWGTGFSDNVPLMTDKAWPASFLDANNNLRTDLTFSEIAKAISNGELSEDVLNDMTLQIGNKGWVYASELFDGVTKEVEVGTKVIEGGSHIEMVPEVVTRTRTITEVVKNQRAIDALNVLGKGADILGKADTVHNVAEIVRPTSSNLNSNKKADRKYDYDDSEYYV